MYKLVICNMGYENIWLCHLDGNMYHSLQDAINELRETIDNEVEIDGFPIKLTRFNITKKDFEDKESIVIVETYDIDHCIYISQKESA